jgi:hypothetical protein
LIGKRHWKSSYDHTADLLEKERKRLAREKQLAWLEEQRAKGRWKEEEERWRRQQAAAVRQVQEMLSAPGAIVQNKLFAVS